jgi:7-cyano-7-deazaguanine reductase
MTPDLPDREPPTATRPAYTAGLTQLGSEGPTQPTAVLEVFPNPHPDRIYHIHIESPEFTSNCPVTGQPDFATVILEYVPGPHCVELKAYKRYLWHFRTVDAFYEDVTNQITNELVAALDPRWLRLTTLWNVRGGIYTTIVVAHGDPALAPPYPPLRRT